MKTGRKYGEKEKIQILIKSLIFRTLRIYIFSFYAFLFFVSLADAESNICKYNAVIINDITLFWRDKSYAEGRLRDRKLARICK